MQNENFLKAKSMDFPRSVLLGHKVLDQVSDMCRSLQFRGPGVIVTGDATLKAAGKRVGDILSENYDVQIISLGEANLENVEKGASLVNEIDADFIVAVGGGSKIDLGKLISKETKRPFVSIPTSVAHDGIASDRASLKSDVGPKSVIASSPAGIIADTEVIAQAPFRYLSSGCADVISNLTALNDWTYAVEKNKESEFSSSAYVISKYAADNIILNSKDIKANSEEGVWLTLRPIIASGVSMCIAGNSRPTSGSEHMFSHALDTYYAGKSLHGEQCGVGSIMMMYLQGGDWEMLRDAISGVGSPIDAKGLGLGREEIINSLVRAAEIRPDRFTILGDGLTPEAAEELAEATGVL